MPMESFYKKCVSFSVFIFSFFLSSQLGKHFFFPFSYLSGIRIDYLAPTLYLIDILSLPFVIYSSYQFLKKNTFDSYGFSFAVLFLICCNAYFSLSWPLWIYTLARFIQWMGIYYFFTLKSHKKNVFSAVLYGLIIGGFFELILALLQLSSRHSIQGWWYFLGERSFSIFTPGIAKAYFLGVEFLRPYGTFAHPNSLAGFYLLLYSFALTQKRITNTILKTLFLFVSSALILISFSRTAIIVYVLINILYFFKKSLACRTCFFAKITMALFLILFAFSIAGDRNSLQKRNDFAQKAVSIIAQKPFTGTGIGSYLIAQHHYPQKFSTFFEQPVHNIFLLLIAQLGIPLSLLLLTMIIRIIIVRIRTVAFTLPLLVVLLTGSVDHYWFTLQQNALVMAVIFGILIVYEDKTSSSRTG